MVDNEGEKCLVKAVSPAYLPQPEDLTPEAFRGVQHVHLTYTRHDLAMKAVERARAAGASVSLDLEAADIPPDGGRVAELLGNVDLLFVSDQSRTAAERTLGPLSLGAGRTIVTTRGSAGAQVDNASGVVQVPGHSVPVTDTSGAGDAFAAAFLHCRLEGADDVTSLRFANASAALSTCAYGAQAGLPRHDAVTRFLETRSQEKPDV
jgi:ribokinase